MPSAPLAPCQIPVLTTPRRLARNSWLAFLTIIAMTWGVNGWIPAGHAAPPPPSEEDAEDSEMELDADDESLDYESSMDDRRTSRPAPMTRTGVVEDGPGVLGNISFLGMQTFGRDDSIAPLEILPYMLLDEHFFFSDVRGFISTEGRFGGNFGAGYRHLVPNQNAWYGVNAFYDVDDTSSQMFHQLGIGAEAAFQSFEVRGNAYFPIGNTSQTLERSATNARFVGNQLLFDQQVTQGYALRGVDAEVGYVRAIPQLGENTKVRWFVGGYFFSGNGGGDSINGFQTRTELQLASTVTTHLQFSKDKEYGSNLMVGVALDLPYGESHPTSKWRRNTPSPFRFVHRNYNVILDRQDESQFGVVALNPLTSQNYTIAHVDSSAGAGGNGSVTNPYSSLAAAQNNNADLIFVHSDSVLNEAIVLGDGQRLVGDNGRQWIDLPNANTALLPSLNSNGAAPVISGINGNAITLGSNATISGLQFTNIHGNGIVGTDVNNVTLRDLSFSNISGNAIELNNASGGVQFRNLILDDVHGNGIEINGGSGAIALQNVSLTDVTQNALSLSDLTAGSVSLTQFSAERVGQSAVALNNVNAEVTVASLDVDGTGASAIDITGGTGTYLFSGITNLDNAKGGLKLADSAAEVTINDLRITQNASTASAVWIENATAELHLDKLAIDADAGKGVLLRNVDDLTIGAGTIATVGAAAFDAEGSHFDATLSTLSVDGGNVGLRLVDNSGAFIVTGTTAGTIQNTTTGVFLDQAGSVSLTNLALTNNSTAIQSLGSELLSLQSLTVTGSTGYALDSMNDKLLSVQNSIFSGNGALNEGTMRIRADAVNTYRSQIMSNSFTDANGTALYIGNTSSGAGSSLDTVVSGNIFTASRGGNSALQVVWNGPTAITASGNDFTLTGSNMTGVSINGQSTTDALTAYVSNNNFDLSGSTAVGVNILAAGESNVQVETNVVETSGIGATGLRFDLSGRSSTWVASNTITDTGSGATGIHFVKLTDLSRLQLDNNKVDLQSTSSAIDRGIYFTTVTGTIQLYGTTNNTVTGATDDFYIPTGTSTGAVGINGVARP